MATAVRETSNQPVEPSVDSSSARAGVTPRMVGSASSARKRSRGKRGAIERDGFFFENDRFDSSLENAAQALTPLHAPHPPKSAGAALRAGVDAAGGKVLLQSSPKGGRRDRS